MTVFVIVLLLSLAIIIIIITSSKAQTNKKGKNKLGIDEPFFHNVNTECISIRKFMDKLASDSHYMERMDTIIKGEIEVGNETVTDSWDKLRYYLLADLLRCQRGLNRSKSIHDSLPSQEDVFLIEHTLKGYNHELHEEYVRHLFWFTSLIAQNSSPTPTNAEKEWLNHLISLKEEGK